MAHIPMRSIRLKLDKKYCKKCNTVDSLTSQTPATWRANATEIEVGAFEDDIPLDLTGYTGLELVIRPDRTTSTNLAYKASATPDSVTITANGWTAGTDQHVTFSLTDSELNLDLEGKERQTYWLAVTASDASGNETTLGTSWFIVEEDNNATAAAPEENPGTGITEDIADARYIAKAEIDAKGDLITGSADDTPTILTRGADGQVLTASSAQPEGLLWTTVSGTGDMQAATYDPTPIGGDVFDMDNMVEGATTKILTDVERADIASNKAASHAAVTVSDSAEIDLTLTGQDISASIIAGSIDETKLDASTNISLGKANTSVQPNDDAAILGSGAAADGLVLKADGIGGAAWETDAGGGGGVTGPVTSTDNALARYDGTSGDFVQDSAVTVDDSGNITANNFTGTSSGANTGDQDLSTYQVKPSEGAFVNGDKTKLDGIAAGADVNDPTTLVDADIGVNVQAYSSVLGATTASFLTTDETKLDGIEELADVTDTINVTAAGALMDSEVTNLAQVKAFDTTDYAAALGVDDNYVTDAEKVVIGNTSGTNTGDQDLSTYQLKPAEGAFVDGDKTKLDGIETSADVTDATNVVSSLSGATLTDAGVPASDDKVLIQDTSDSNNLKYVDVSDIGGGGGGDVSAAPTPSDNQVAVWTGASEIEGTGSLTYDGSTLGVTGDITVTGTVDGVDIASRDHNEVTIAASGGRDYVTISGTQQLTLHTVDLTADVSGDLPVADGGTGASDAVTARTNLGVQSVMGFALSDETSALTTGQKIATDMPVSMNVKRVYASVGTAGGTSAITIDVEDEGVTILNAVVSISAGANNAETSTFTGAASSYQLTKGDALTIDVDSIDDGTANGLKVYLIGDITA